MPETNKAEARPLTQTIQGDPNYAKVGMELLLRTLGDSNAKFEVDENDVIKTTYKPMLQNLQAQTQATEQAGLPSYGGIDAENVMQLMKQRAVQDQQFRQQPLDMSQMLYQQRLGQAANPIHKIRQAFIDNAMRSQLQQEKAEQTQVLRGVPQAITSERVDYLTSAAEENRARAKYLKSGGGQGSRLAQEKLDIANQKLIELQNKATRIAAEKAMANPSQQDAALFNVQTAPDNSNILMLYDDGGYFGQGYMQPIPLGTANVGAFRQLAAMNSKDANTFLFDTIAKAKQLKTTPTNLIQIMMKKVAKPIEGE